MRNSRKEEADQVSSTLTDNSDDAAKLRQDGILAICRRKPKNVSKPYSISSQQDKLLQDASFFVHLDNLFNQDIVI